MKKGAALFPILFIICFFGFHAVFSQDDRMPDSELIQKENRSESSLDLLLEGESKIVKPVMQYRDSTQLKTTSKKPDKGKPDENASVLSFNFLYYLIERYKLADIID